MLMITKDIVLIDRLRKRLPGGKTPPPGVIDEPVFAKNRERIIFVVDRSGSMGRRDYRPNRLKAGGAAVEEFITALTDLYLLSENRMFISDYNAHNHSYKIQDVPVIVQESPEIEYYQFSRQASLSCVVGDKVKNKRSYYNKP